MARRAKTNPYETQAKLSLVLAAVGGLSALALIVFILPQFNWADDGSIAITYLVGGKRFYAILGATLVAGAASAIGFFVSLNCAGQRRNPLSRLAWTAFFVNAAVILVTLCAFVVFWLAKEPVYPTG